MNYIKPNPNMVLSYGGRSVTKKDIITYLRRAFMSNEYETVSDFETQRTRHICKGQKKIVLLEKQLVGVPISPTSTANIEVFFCQNCRKLLINSQSLEVL